MSKKTFFFVLLGVFCLGLIFLLVTFGSQVKFQNTGSSMEYGITESISPPDMAYVPTADSSMARDSLINDEEGSKVQKNGSVTFLVDSIDDALSSVREINSKYLAEITNIFDSGRGNDRVLTVTVKLPVDDFETYYEDIREIDGEVTYANVSTLDVTEEYIDITSRLTNLRSVEGQLVEILQKAQSVTDILAVQTQLNSVRGDIESYEQRKRYFDSQTDYSYLSLSFSIDKSGISISDEQWKPLGEFRAALNALVSVLKGFVNMSIWLLVFSPVVLIPVGLGMYISKRKKRE